MTHVMLMLFTLAPLAPLAPPETRPTIADPGGAAAGPPARVEAAAESRDGDAYYLGVCAACDALLGTKGETITRIIDGRDLRFCCAACRERWTAAPVECAARLDRIMIADQLPHYPLKTSIVSGRPLGDRPIDVILGNRLFRLADESERAALASDLPRRLDALDRAVIAAQAPSYGMPTKCPVQGDILDSDTPIDIVVANRMIRVCCMRCVRMVRAHPSQYLPMIEFANRAAAEERAHRRDAGLPP